MNTRLSGFVALAGPLLVGCSRPADAPPASTRPAASLPSPALHPWVIIIMLSMTVPVTTLLLARVALFRRRVAGAADTPAPLTPPGGS